MRILITGASGMFGATMVRMFSQLHEVYATGNSDFEHSFVNYKTFDLTSNNYQDLIDWAKPELIILSGALTNGNFCHENPSLAFEVNGISVNKFINGVDPSVKFIYISTDAVFPSTLHAAKESDCVSPENVYGKSKELGEFYLLNSNRKFTIIRTTIVGFNLNKEKEGFIEWIINSAKNAQEIGLFEDVVFNPITIWDLALEILFLIDNNKINSEILHVSGTEISTKYEFGVAVLNALGLNSTNIKKSKILDFNMRAKRCTDQTLDCSYYEKKYHRNLPNLESTVNNIKKYFNEKH